MSFLKRLFGGAQNKRPPRPQSFSSEQCIISATDNEKACGTIRKTTVLAAIQEHNGDRNPTQSQLDFTAMITVMRFYWSSNGLSDNQIKERVHSGASVKYVVQWYDTLSDVLVTVPNETWNVPCALVMFSRDASVEQQDSTGAGEVWVIGGQFDQGWLFIDISSGSFKSDPNEVQPMDEQTAKKACTVANQNGGPTRGVAMPLSDARRRARR